MSGPVFLTRFLRGASLAIVLAACPAAASPDGASTQDAVSSFKLDNGLEVVVIPDRRAPIVTHMVWYKIGSADKPPGKWE